MMLPRDTRKYAAKEAADSLIARYGITQPEQIVLEDIAWDRGVRIESSALQSVEAWLFSNGHNAIIRVRDQGSETGRRRFSIAHELGHWECHRSESQVWVCTTGDVHAYKGSALEIEANAFAAALLMPRSILAALVSGKPLSIALARDIAEQFNTSLTAAAVRLVEESKTDCCVVFSDGYSVQWSKKSNTADGIWIPKVISDSSWAWDCDTEPQDSRGLRKVKPEIWLSGRALHEYTEVWEESVFLPAYQTILTLLEFV